MGFFLSLVYLLVVAAGIGSMALLYFRGKRTAYHRLYLACQAMAVIWCMAQILAMASGSEGEWKASYLLGNLGICFIGCFWYYFSVSYTGRTAGRMERMLPLCLSLFHYGAVLTNEWHHLYYRVFSREKLVHGVLFYSNVASVYLLVIGGAFLLFHDFAGRRDSKRGRQLILASVLIPICLNGLYLTGMIRPEFDITPLGFGVSVILVFLATMKYQFLEVNITAFDMVLSGLTDGVAVFDEKGEGTYRNQAFCKLLHPVRQEKNAEKRETNAAKWRTNAETGNERREMENECRKAEKERSRDAEGECNSELFGECVLNLGQVMEELDSFREYEEGQDSFLRQNGNGQCLQVQIYQMTGGQKDFQEIVPPEHWKEGDQTVLLVRDMSRYIRMLRQERELAIANEKLALEQERNRIAQQVHDIVGHTLTMLQSYLRLALTAEKQGDREEVVSYLTQGRELSADGLRQLRESIRQMKRENACELVTQGVMQLADQVKEIAVEFTVQGEDSERYSHLSGICYSCAREMITNTLKHAEASRLEIILRFQENGLELVMGDDGRGCEEMEEGNGVKGIRKRVEEVGGSVRFLTAAGEGFLMRVYLPI